MNKQKNNIKINYIYSLMYQMTAIFVPLITTPYLSRILLPDGIGDYGYAFAIVALFNIVSLFGFNIYGQREIAKHSKNKYEKSKVFFEIWIAKFIISTLVVIIFITLTFLGVFGDSYIKLLICFLPSLLSGILDSTYLLRGEEQFKIITIRDFIIKIIGIIAIFVFVKTEDSVWIYALCHSIIAFLSVSSLLLYIPKNILKVPIKELKIWKHFYPSFRLFIPAISVSVFAYVDKTMILWITSENVEVGYYEQAEKLISMLFGLVATLGSVMIPRNSAVASCGRMDNLYSNINKAMKLSFFITFPMTFGIIAVSKIFCPVFFGPGFEKTATLFSLLAPILILMAISNVLGMQFLVPTDRDKIYSRFVFAAALVHVFVNVVLIHFYKSIGAVVGALLSETLCALMFIIYCKKFIDIKKIIFDSWKIIISAVVMFIFVFFTANIAAKSIISVLLLAIEGVALYSFMLYLLKDEMFFYLCGIVKEGWQKIISTVKKR